MRLLVPRCLLSRGVDPRRDKPAFGKPVSEAEQPSLGLPTAVGDGQLESGNGRTLVVTGAISGQPDEDSRNGAELTSSHQEESA